MFKTLSLPRIFRLSLAGGLFLISLNAGASAPQCSELFNTTTLDEYSKSADFEGF